MGRNCCKRKTAQTDYSVTAHLTPGEWTGNMVFYASVGDTYTVEVGDNSVLLSPAYEDKTHIVFESDNPSVASISSDGHIIASAIGTANITKTAYDSTGTRVIYSSKYTINVTAQMPLMDVSRLASVLTTLSSQEKTSPLFRSAIIQFRAMQRPMTYPARVTNRLSRMFRPRCTAAGGGAFRMAQSFE